MIINNINNMNIYQDQVELIQTQIMIQMILTLFPHLHIVISNATLGLTPSSSFSVCNNNN